MAYRKIISISSKAILETIVAFLVFVFLYTGLSKYLSMGQFRVALAKSPMLADYREIVSLILPGVELVTVTLLVWSKTRLIGLYGSLVLLFMFTIYLIYMVSFDSRLPCSCGGIISQLSWHQHIVFNVVLIVLNIVGIRLQRGKRFNRPAIAAGN